MNSWQLTSLVVLVVLTIVIGGGGWLVLRYSRERKLRLNERLLAAKQAAAEKASVEKTTAPHSNHIRRTRDRSDRRRHQPKYH